MSGSLNVTAAKHGGFIVVERNFQTGDHIILRAGTLDECLAHLRQHFESQAPDGAMADPKSGALDDY